MKVILNWVQWLVMNLSNFSLIETRGIAQSGNSAEMQPSCWGNLVVLVGARHLAFAITQLFPFWPLKEVCYLLVFANSWPYCR